MASWRDRLSSETDLKETQRKRRDFQVGGKSEDTHVREAGYPVGRGVGGEKRQGLGLKRFPTQPCCRWDAVRGPLALAEVRVPITGLWFSLAQFASRGAVSRQRGVEAGKHRPSTAKMRRERLCSVARFLGHDWSLPGAAGHLDSPALWEDLGRGFGGAVAGQACVSARVRGWGVSVGC